MLALRPLAGRRPPRPAPRRRSGHEAPAPPTGGPRAAGAALLLALLLPSACVTPRPAGLVGGGPAAVDPALAAGAGPRSDGLVGPQEPTPLELTPLEPAPLEPGPLPTADGPGPEQEVWATERARGGARRDEREPAYGAINLLFGDRELDSIEEPFGDLAEQKVYGLEGVVLPVPRWPFGIEIGGFLADESDTLPFGNDEIGIEVRTLETYAGLRLFLHRALPGGFPLEPFVSAGLSRVFYDVDVDIPQLGPLGFGDGASGHYFRVGLQGRLHQRLHVGVELRWLEGADARIQLPAPLGATDFEFDHRQAAVFVGVRL